MSKRTERRAAEHAQRKLAYQQLRQQSAQSEAIAEQITPEPSPSISEAQLAANRANAQLSCGPKSIEGKAICSQNALKLGLTGRTVVLAGEDQVEYQRQMLSLTERFAPATDEELRLVQSLLDTNWRLNRILRTESAIFLKGQLEFADKFKDRNPLDQESLILAETYLKYEKSLRNLHIQEGRLRRSREKDQAELTRLQTIRKRQEAQAAEAAATSSRPVAGRNGFVFSNLSAAASDLFSAAPVPVNFTYPNP